MTNDADTKGYPMKTILIFVGSVIAYGVLMGTRTEFKSPWVRALIAGCAGVFMAILLSPLSRRKKT